MITKLLIDYNGPYMYHIMITKWSVYLEQDHWSLYLADYYMLTLVRANTMHSEQNDFGNHTAGGITSELIQ